MEEAHHESNCAAAILFLNPDVVGGKVAAAAAEAMVKLDFMFAIDARLLHRFLSTPLLSNSVKPQQNLRKIRLLIDEMPTSLAMVRKGMGSEK